MENNEYLARLRANRDRWTGLEAGGIISAAKAASLIKETATASLIRARRYHERNPGAVAAAPRLFRVRLQVEAVRDFLEDAETINALRVHGHRRWPVEVLRECLGMLDCES